MRYRLTRIEPMSAAKTLAYVYVVLGLIGGAIHAACARPVAEPFGVVVTVLLGSLFGFVGTLICVWAYNLGAGWTRGVEVHLDPADE